MIDTSDLADVDGALRGARPAPWTSRAPAWLQLAATPTFTAMALVAGFGGSPSATPCPTSHGLWPLGAMATMYLLMGVFHAGPWLTRLAAFRGRPMPSITPPGAAPPSPNPARAGRSCGTRRAPT